jgi:serine/threonine protein kinase
MGHSSKNEHPKETGGEDPAQQLSHDDEHCPDDDVDETLAHEGPPLAKTIALGSTGEDTVARAGQPRTGAVFGNYELLEMIGRGGMGVVYRARQINLNRIVAVKMIRSQVLATDEDIQRFYIEAQAAGGLGHPNIVTVYEMGEFDGQQFFSMDYVEGTDLAKLSKGGRLPREQIAKYVKDIATAVHYAHERGILHRDLKPANILIDARGRPHITDFGLAKQVDDDSHMTREGAVLGTPSYMSPEQAAGRQKDVDKSTDIYALGAILYELLTGRPPFRGDSVVETLMDVVHREPARPRDIEPDVDRDLEAICLKCIEKDPRRRYATAGELADDLDRFLRGVPILARPPSTRERISFGLAPGCFVVARWWPVGSQIRMIFPPKK